MARAADRVVHALLRSLHVSGVRHLVISPGSRNTPITVAATAPGSPIRTWLHLDERSAGYFALGLARQLGEPVAVTCTSGTAAANYLPAVVEARLSRVPLIVLTADRPPEARDVGAQQTIDQVDIYGRHAKWAVDLPPADTEAVVELERYWRVTAARAAAVAREHPAGPVHLNLPFREPLVEPGGGPAFTAEDAHVEIASKASPPADDAVSRVGAAVSGKRGLILAGPESQPLPAAPILALAAALGWPVIADPLSGLRAGTHDRALVIDAADALMRVPEFVAQATPEVVLRFGAGMTCKPLNEWIAARPDVTRILVDPAGVGTAGWRDPEMRSGLVVAAEARMLCDALLAHGVRAAAAEWAALWCEANAAARQSMEHSIAALGEAFEGQPVLDLRAALPAGATLVAGNSMPVRDIDSFFFSTPTPIRIVGTRGASGIDGVVSTAAGASAAGQGPVALLIGDLSFFHDTNGLWPVGRYGLDLTVILVNNGGGGIFNFLPQRGAVPDRFDDWWGTAPGIEPRHAVALHHGRHAMLEAGGQRAAIADALARPGLDVLELRTERDRNVALHREIWAEAATAVRTALGSAVRRG